MNKKEYMRPSLQVVAVKTKQMIAVSGPQLYNEKSNNASYSRGGNEWDWEEDED